MQRKFIFIQIFGLIMDPQDVKGREMQVREREREEDMEWGRGRGSQHTRRSLTADGIKW